MCWVSMFKLKSWLLFFIMALVLFVSAFVVYTLNKKELGCEVLSNSSHLIGHNAACLIIKDNQFLTVLNRSKNAWDLPGGTAQKNESAQCVAQRETFEEVGIVAQPIKKLHEYDNGFVLYLCEISKQAYQPSYTVPLLARLEVKDIQWHTVDGITDLTWRFPEFWPETKAVIERTFSSP